MGAAREDTFDASFQTAVYLSLTFGGLRAGGLCGAASRAGPWRAAWVPLGRAGAPPPPSLVAYGRRDLT